MSPTASCTCGEQCRKTPIAKRNSGTKQTGTSPGHKSPQVLLSRETASSSAVEGHHATNDTTLQVNSINRQNPACFTYRNRRHECQAIQFTTALKTANNAVICTLITTPEGRRLSSSECRLPWQRTRPHSRQLTHSPFCSGGPGLCQQPAHTLGNWEDPHSQTKVLARWYQFPKWPPAEMEVILKN